MARDQDDCERYEPLPQHCQAGTGRSGAARLSCQAAPIPPQWEQHLQSLYAEIIPKSLVSKYDTKLFIWRKCKIIVPPRCNYACLLNRGWVQYEPTGTAHSIGELGQRKNTESSHPASRLTFSCHPPRRCRCCDWMEKRAFYTKGEKAPMKWHIAPSNSARSYRHRKRCIFQIFLLVTREYHMV